MSNILKIELDPKRVFGLDILRALAILFVVIEHGNNLLPQKLKGFTNLFIYDGVSVFFVLSGFLIGGILIKSIDKNKITTELLTNFWIRRWFRTLPNYFLVLILLCFLHTCFIANFSPFSVANYFIFSQNLFQPHPAWFFPEAWSLSVEEWFYLVVPVVMLVSIRLFKIPHGTGVLGTAIAILLLVTAFRYYRYTVVEINSGYELELFFRKQVITRLDSLMFGVIGAYLNFYHFKKWIAYKKTLLLAGVLLFLLSKFVLKRQCPLMAFIQRYFLLRLFPLQPLCCYLFSAILKKGKALSISQ